MVTPIKLLTGLIFTCIVLASCNKDKRLMYENDPRVYFYKSPRGAANDADSVMFSFGIYPPGKTTDTILLKLQVMGLVSDKDRLINIMVDDSSTAKEGYHYTMGEKIMPAGEGRVDIPVVLYRKPGLIDSTVNLYLTIGESVDFKPGYTDSGTRLSRLRYKISFTSKLLKPGNWDNSLVNLFGAYSMVKHQYVILWTGIQDLSTLRFPADQNFAVQTVKAALAAYEQANGPLYDENGQRVTLPY